MNQLGFVTFFLQRERECGLFFKGDREHGKERVWAEDDLVIVYLCQMSIVVKITI